MTSLTGVIQSPNFPNSYPNGLSCVYIISVPEDYRVTLTFTTLDLEASLGCGHDYVEVWDCCAVFVVVTTSGGANFAFVVIDVVVFLVDVVVAAVVVMV